MNRTKIEWTDYTWNPIKGLCPVGCWYCYARRMYKRFGWEDTIFMQESELYEPAKLKKPSKIFICSTIELFHLEVKFNTGAIFNVIKENPQHTFQILTKFPENIDRPMPDNVWLGVTITGEEGSWEKTAILHKLKAKKKFISLEPFLEHRIFDWEGIDWLIIGRLTGHGRKYDPQRDWIESRVKIMRNAGIPIFLKNNLKDIWKEPLIQEFPND